MGNRLTGPRLVLTEPTLDNSKPAETLKNPGPVEDIHKECQNIMPVPFAGVTLKVNKNFSIPVRVSQTTQLTSFSSPVYRFGVAYMGTNLLSPKEVFPLIKGDIDSTGILKTTFTNQKTQNLRCSVDTEIKNKKATKTSMRMNYEGLGFNASITLADSSTVPKGSVQLSGQFTQAITSKLSIGYQLEGYCRPTSFGCEVFALCGAARYVSKLGTWSATIGYPELRACYHRKVSNQLQVGIELEANPILRQKAAKFGCQIDLPRPELVFRGMVDTKWRAAAVLEMKLRQLPCTFAISGNFNNQFIALGCALTLD